MDYDFIHKCVQDFRRYLVDAGIFLGDGNQLGNIGRFISVRQLVKAFVIQLSIDIILIDLRNGQSSSFI